MGESVTISNCYCAYIKNDHYGYPYDEDERETEVYGHYFNTGWQVLPNILFRHYFTPRQWAEFCIKYQAYSYSGYRITLFNMVPMTTQISFQQTSVYTAFNNTIYAWGYQDTEYETPWCNWYAGKHKYQQPNLAYKEGLQMHGGTTTKRLFLPHYEFRMPNSRPYNEFSMGNSTQSAKTTYPDDGIPRGVFWDPLNKPNSILEFRPGKNAITFTHTVADCDKGKVFNIDQMASWAPYTPTGPYSGIAPRPGCIELTATNDPDKITTQYERLQRVACFAMCGACLQCVL